MFVNRITGYDCPMARRTAETAKAFAANLKWELGAIGFGAEWLVERMREKHPTFLDDTAKKWLNAETANPPKDMRETLRDIFGYVDADSIRRDDHIERRQKSIARSANGFSPIDESIGRLTIAIDQSASATADETRSVIEQVLASPMAPYLSLTAFLLKTKLAIAEANKLLELSRHR